VAGLVAAHLERFGRLDVLVNSAGVGIGAPIEETTTKALDLLTAVNLRSIVLAYRESSLRSSSRRRSRWASPHPSEGG
jgi:NAD(P)-dependent dehydrogenase (short-subunit alcohol dehydrogenase family)